MQNFDRCFCAVSEACEKAHHLIWGLAVLELKLYTLFCNTVKYSFNCIKGNGKNSTSEEIITIEFEFLVRKCERFMNNTKCIYISISFLKIYATYTIKQNKTGNNFDCCTVHCI